MYGYMMREFSQLTIDGLKSYTLFKLLLPPFKSFIEINLEKELDKTQAVVICAVEAVRLSQPPDHTYTGQLLLQSRDIDQAFLRKAQSLSSAIQINYPEIDRIRQRRIELVIAATYQVLAQWQGKLRLRQAIGGLYSQHQFRSLLLEILNLYIQETQVLSNSVEIPRSLARFRDSLISTIHDVMHKVAGNLVLELTDQVYQRNR